MKVGFRQPSNDGPRPPPEPASPASHVETCFARPTFATQLTRSIFNAVKTQCGKNNAAKSNTADVPVTRRSRFANRRDRTRRNAAATRRASASHKLQRAKFATCNLPDPENASMGTSPVRRASRSIQRPRTDKPNCGSAKRKSRQTRGERAIEQLAGDATPKAYGCGRYHPGKAGPLRAFAGRKTLRTPNRKQKTESD